MNQQKTETKKKSTPQSKPSSKATSLSRKDLESQLAQYEKICENLRSLLAEEAVEPEKPKVTPDMLVDYELSQLTSMDGLLVFDIRLLKPGETIARYRGRVPLSGLFDPSNVVEAPQIISAQFYQSVTKPMQVKTMKLFNSIGQQHMQFSGGPVARIPGANPEYSMDPGVVEDDKHPGEYRQDSENVLGQDLDDLN
jgi:hypothetical protein